ncbi:MAG: type I-B CRISPR-associated protein Cas7/Csh2 [Elusimicrobiales bacterium]|nr:type I-B CRISPR-associated protein Cas7/Csh2 [Elusimicrobiales bacterium]
MIIKNRSEILFLYDVKDANPNGDADENRPRIDEEVGVNLVTDVRLKRTIRDYLYNYKKNEIFIREIEYEPGKIQNATMRAEDFLYDEDNKKIDKSKFKGKIDKMKEIIQKNILKDCIDVRLFGCTIPLEFNDKDSSSITFTGPVQFSIGRSLHKVDEVYIKGTGAFASGKDKEQKTFREEYLLYYSFICFYGIINENAAQHTQLTENDVENLIEAIWNGTKNLITRSKMNHNPRFLLQIIYKEDCYHIGDLRSKIKLNSSKMDEELRDIKDFVVDISELLRSIDENRNKILKIRYKKDPELKLSSELPSNIFEEIKSF